MTVRAFVHSVTGRTVQAREGSRLFDLVSGDDNYREEKASGESKPAAKKSAAKKSAAKPQ